MSKTHRPKTWEAWTKTNDTSTAFQTKKAQNAPSPEVAPRETKAFPSSLHLKSTLLLNWPLPLVPHLHRLWNSCCCSRGKRLAATPQSHSRCEPFEKTRELVNRASGLYRRKRQRNAAPFDRLFSGAFERILYGHTERC